MSRLNYDFVHRTPHSKIVRLYFLLSSESKYDSGTGWPSFYEAYQNSSSHSNVIERPENSADIATFRTEVICKKVCSCTTSFSDLHHPIIHILRPSSS